MFDNKKSVKKIEIEMNMNWKKACTKNKVCTQTNIWSDVLSLRFDDQTNFYKYFVWKIVFQKLFELLWVKRNSGPQRK